MDDLKIKGGSGAIYRHGTVIGPNGKEYEYDMHDYLKDFNSRILNITHDDLDGAVSAIVIKNVYPNCITARTKYDGPLYREAIDQILQADKYDGIIFSDFCPNDEMIDAVHKVKKPYLVIDHHQTAKIRDDDVFGLYYVVQGRCGALLCLDYFKDVADLSLLYDLCEVTNDHDLWLRKMIPLSDDLNTLLYEYGFNRFIDKFINGLEPGKKLPEDAKALLANHEHEVDEYIAQCVQKELPYNGHYIECNKFNSDINKRMTPMYDWLVMVNTVGGDPGTVKLEFRTKRKDINFGKFLNELGRGGGGHPAAAGQTIPAEEKDEFLQMVGDKLFGGK